MRRINEGRLSMCEAWVREGWALGVAFRRSQKCVGWTWNCPQHDELR